MAWANIEVPNFRTTNWLHDNYLPSRDGNPTTDYGTLNIYWMPVVNTWQTLADSNNIRLEGYQSVGRNYARLIDKTNNTEIVNLATFDNSRTYIVALVDDVNQLGVIGIQYNTPDNTNIYGTIPAQTPSNYLYNLLKSNIPQPYNWVSVPSVSGKNGILSLAQIKSEYINDGEPVSGAESSYFTGLGNNNRVSLLVDDVLPSVDGGTDVTVKYSASTPTGSSFTTLKLVVKKGLIPKDATDGDVIYDISASKTRKIVTGLESDSLYYFVIFAEDTDGNKTASDEAHIKTAKTTVILDSEEKYVTTIISDFVKAHDVGGDWYIGTEEHDYPYCLVKTGTYGTALCTSKTKLRKDQATMMYVDIEGRDGGLSTSHIAILFARQLTNGLPIYDDEYFYTAAGVEVVNTPWTEFPRKVVACPLDNITGDFYIAFLAGDIGNTVIRKIWFNKSVSTVQDEE